MKPDFQELTPKEKQAHYAELEVDLNFTMDELAGISPQADFGEALEYLKHGEYGLCFDTILFLILEENIRSVGTLVQPLTRLRERMSSSDTDESVYQDVLAALRVS